MINGQQPPGHTWRDPSSQLNNTAETAVYGHWCVCFVLLCVCLHACVCFDACVFVCVCVQVVRTASLTHWASCLDLSPESPLVAVGIGGEWKAVTLDQFCFCLMRVCKSFDVTWGMCLYPPAAAILEWKSFNKIFSVCFGDVFPCCDLYRLEVGRRHIHALCTWQNRVLVSCMTCVFIYFLYTFYTCVSVCQ